MNFRHFCLPAGLTCLALAGSFARADAPRAIPFSAVVKTAAGMPLNAPVSVTFNIYKPDASLAWSETQSLTPVDGLVATRLNPPASVLFNQAYTVGVTVGSNQEMTPTVAFGAVPYALSLPNVVVSSTGNVGIGTAAPGSMLTVAGTIESTTGGVKFPDGTTQATAQLAGPAGPQGAQGDPGPQGPAGPYPGTSLGFTSGLPHSGPATYSMTYQIDSKDVTATGVTLGGFTATVPITANTGGQFTLGRLVVGPLTLRRPRTADNTWAVWGTDAQPNMTHTAVIKLIAANGAPTPTTVCTWTFANGLVSSYSLRLADDGLPVEQITLDSNTFTRVQIIPGAMNAPLAGVVNHRGYTSGLPSGTTYRLNTINGQLMGASRSDPGPYVVTSDLGYLHPVTTNSGTKHLGPFVNDAPFTVRDNPGDRVDLFNWFGSAAGFAGSGQPSRPFTLQLALPGHAGTLATISGKIGVPDSYSLYLADDGLPVEDFEISHTGITVQ